MQQAPAFHVKDGQLIGARQIPSPNYNQRPENTEIQLIVVHNISLPPSQFGGGYIEQFFQNQLDWSVHPYFQTIQGMQVSTHLLILRSGKCCSSSILMTGPGMRVVRPISLRKNAMIILSGLSLKAAMTFPLNRHSTMHWYR